MTKSWPSQRHSGVLAKRIVTGGLIAAVLTAGMFYLPEFWFESLILAIGVVAGLEWTKLCGMRETSRRIAYCLLLIALTAILMQLKGSAVYVNGTATVFWAALAGFLLYPVVGGTRLSSCIACSVLILAFAVFAASELRSSVEHGAWLLLGGIAVVAMADIGAYFVGRAFGKRKLARHISPGKTVEGAIGGLTGVAIAALIAGHYVWGDEYRKVAVTALICIAAAVVSIFGDLYVSKAKRFAGVKDSGRLLPGHGGVLDRVDSALAGLPVYSFGVKLFLAQS